MTSGTRPLLGPFWQSSAASAGTFSPRLPCHFRISEADRRLITTAGSSRVAAPPNDLMTAVNDPNHEFSRRRALRIYTSRFLVNSPELLTFRGDYSA